METASISTWERIRRRTWFWFGVVVMLAVPVPAFWYCLTSSFRGYEFVSLGIFALLYLVIGVGFVRRSLRSPPDPLSERPDR